MTRDWLLDFILYELDDDEFQTGLESSDLDVDWAIAQIDLVQRKVSAECGLIPTCYHWPSIAGQAEYKIENYPDLFVREYSRRCSVYWKLAGLRNGSRNSLYKNFVNYSDSGTPLRSTVPDQRGGKKMIVLQPAPDVTEGTGTWATDPIHFYCYRLPKLLETTGGYLEVDAILHEAVRLGARAALAKKIKHPSAGEWKAEYIEELALRRKPEGIRNPIPARIHHKFNIENFSEGALEWLGLYEPGIES